MKLPVRFTLAFSFVAILYTVSTGNAAVEMLSNQNGNAHYDSAKADGACLPANMSQVVSGQQNSTEHTPAYAATGMVDPMLRLFYRMHHTQAAVHGVVSGGNTQADSVLFDQPHRSLNVRRRSHGIGGSGGGGGGGFGSRRVGRNGAANAINSENGGFDFGLDIPAGLADAGNDPDADNGDNVIEGAGHMPEPATFVVWLVLATIGVCFIRRKR